MTIQFTKYGVQNAFTFPMIKRGVVDLAGSADWTPATGDVKISQGSGSFTNTTNLPSIVGGTGSAMWALTLTAAELSTSTIDIQIVDSATKAVEDQTFKIYTFGNALAKIAADWSDIVRLGLTALPNVASGSAGALLVDGTGTAAIANSSGRVLVQSGTGAGQLNLNSGVVDANTVSNAGTAITSAAGRMEVNVSHFGGTAGTFAAGVPGVNTLQWRGVQPNNLASGRLDVTIGALQAAVIAASSFAADAIDSNALAATAVTEIVAAVKALVIETNGSLTFGQAMSVILAAVAGVTSGGGNTLKDPSGTSTRIAATIDGSNNRTAMTLTPST